MNRTREKEKERRERKKNRQRYKELNKNQNSFPVEYFWASCCVAVKETGILYKRKNVEAVAALSCRLPGIHYLQK